MYFQRFSLNVQSNLSSDTIEITPYEIFFHPAEGSLFFCLNFKSECIYILRYTNFGTMVLLLACNSRSCMPIDIRSCN